jgi:outer membrane protein assembly factor BamB
VTRWLLVWCLVTLLLPAAAGAQAVTFQSGATHDGDAGTAGLDLPLRKAWTVRVDTVPSYAVIGDGKVFVTVARRDFSFPPHTTLLALSARDGRELWRVELGMAFAASVAYDAGRVFLSVAGTSDENGGLFAYSATTGERLWRTAATDASGDPPVADGGAVYAMVGRTWLAAHRQSDGAQLWIDSPGNGTNGSPAVTGDAVYSALPCGETRKLGRADGALLWRTPSDCHGGGGSTAVFAGGRLYTREREYPPGEFYDAASGSLLGAVRGDFAPAVRGALGLFADARRRGEQWWFGHRLTARSIPSGRVRWRFAGDGYLDTAPLIAGRRAYVGSGGGRVYGVSLRSGRAVWRTSLGVPVHGSDEVSGVIGGLAAAGGILVVPAYGRLVAFR